jgi:D-alanyl-D-alanine carboxypeptidase
VAWVVVATVTVLACAGTEPAPDSDAPSPSTGVTSTGATPTVATTSATSGPPPEAVPQAALDEVRRAYGAPGAMAVLRHGVERVWMVSGAAVLAGTAITPTTSFRIASITKPIVAALVLDAVARGEVGLDDVVADLLPGVLRADPPITVQMLLDHTSGVFNAGDEGDPIADIALLSDPELIDEATSLVEHYEAGEPVMVSARLFVAIAETHDRYFEPGQGYHYSNVNYQLAAMVLEHVTGQALAQLLAERIAEPLALRYTTIAPANLASPDLRGYAVEADGAAPVDLTDNLLAVGNGGSGGIVATADELLAMMHAIVAGGLLAPDLLAEMEAPTPQSLNSYGLGLVTYRLSCGTFYGHEGYMSGTHSIAVMSPDGNSGVVAVLNLHRPEDPGLPALADYMLCAAAGAG